MILIRIQRAISCCDSRFIFTSDVHNYIFVIIFIEIQRIIAFRASAGFFETGDKFSWGTRTS